jgi:cytochrome c-type biogenesis protein
MAVLAHALWAGAGVLLVRRRFDGVAWNTPWFLFGLFGFIEPCSIGTTLRVVKQVEGQSRRQKIAQMTVFASRRAFVIGMLALLAALAGSVFVEFQRTAWFVLGALYLALGAICLGGQAGRLMRSFGPRLNRLRSARGAVALGLLFGLNFLLARRR